MKNEVSCIIPAYNEEGRVQNVIKVAVKSELVDEVIVVNDASTDKTKESVESVLHISKKIKLINLKKNLGKTKSLLAGLRKSRNNYVLFLDADLVGLTVNDISKLVNPVINNDFDVSISFRSFKTILLFKMLGFDFISGERVFNKKLLTYSKLGKLEGFGFEVFFNEIIISKKLKVKIVEWSKVSQVRKFKKVGFIKGYIGDFKMIRTLIRTVGLFEMFSQVLKMRKLKR